MNNEKWNEICFYLSENIRTDISESEFEQNVIQALRVLDWKEFLGDIQIRPSFQIGASNRIMPDFVINSPEKKNLFVIEIKQPSIPLNINFQQQLFSYMRQLRLQYGVLIGQVIQIFYDGDLTEHDDPVLLETIEFNKDNIKGQKFVELFSKENFSKELLESFTLNSLKKINRKSEQKKLHQKILSPDYQTEILELIKQDFLNKYDAELIDNVLKEISITISGNVATEQVTQKVPTKVWESNGQQNTRDKTKYIINGKGKRLPKNRFVLELVKEYLKKTIWLFPLYLLLFNVFVIFIAWGGIISFGSPESAEYFTLLLPLKNGNSFMALLVFIGGFSAVISMIVVSTLALSTMVSNNLVIPYGFLSKFSKSESEINSN